MKQFALGSFAALLLLAGCGGSSGTPAGGSQIVREVGPFAATSQGAPKPAVFMGTWNTSFIGLFGTTFTDVKFRLPPIAAADPDSIRANSLLGLVGNRRLWLMPANYREGYEDFEPVAFPGTGTVKDVSFSGTGTRLATVEPVNGTDQIFTYNLDGSDRRQVTSVAGQPCRQPSYSPDGTKVAFIRDEGAVDKICTVGWSGGTVTQLSTAGVAACPEYSPDGTQIAYLMESGESCQLWTMTSAGGSKTLRASVNTTGPESLDWTSNGKTIMFIVSAGANDNAIYAFQFDTGGERLINAPIKHVSCDPFGESMVFSRIETVNTVWRYQLYDWPVLLTNKGNFEAVEWGPYMAYRLLVGTGAPLGTDVGGFVGGFNDTTMASFLAFDATTRTSLDVQVVGSTGEASFASLLVTGDQLKMIRYLNQAMAQPVTVISPTIPTSYAKGAMVNYNEENGKVSLVIPYVYTEADSGRSASTGLRGRLLAVFDENGKNLAPNGAAEVRFDPKTGAAIDIR